MNIISSRFFIVAAFVYALFFSSYTYYVYLEEKKSILNSIDKELLHGASTLPLLLDENFHHKNMLSRPISKQQDLQNIHKLSTFVQTTNLIYIYTFILKDGLVYFTSCSATEDELRIGGDSLSYFADVYKEKTPLLLESFKTKKIAFENSTDQWGTFRSVYIPKVAADGTVFVAGADYKMDTLKNLEIEALKRLMFLLLPIAFFLSIYAILVWLLQRKLEATIVKHNSELLHNQYTDKLTSLPNRNQLIDDLENQDTAYLALLNADRFSALNDIYGHELCDKFLKFIATLIQDSIKELPLTLYRLQADEFALRASKDISGHDFETTILRILHKIERSRFIDEEYELSIIFSAGISSDDDQMLNKADIALKIAKSTKSDLFTYDEQLHSETASKKKQAIILEIQEALKEERIFPFFQAIYDIKTGEINKYEALIRLQKSDGQIMAPAYFLKLAQEAKLYRKLTQLMLDSVLKKAKKYEDLTFSINISALDIEDKEVCESIIKKIRNSGVASRIVVEILESEEFSNFDILNEFVNSIKWAGAKVSIDDFGSGYSNFSNLVQLDIDYLKIDGALVKDILNNSDYEKIIIAIVFFAKNIKLKTIAEFVEDEEIASRLKELGVDMLQGYHIAKPQKEILD